MWAVILVSLILVYNPCSLSETKPLLTLDEFFNYTQYSWMSFSPTGDYLMIQMKRPLWDTNTFESSLWLYEMNGQQRILITRQLSSAFKPLWSPTGDWIALSLNGNPKSNGDEHEIKDDEVQDQRIYLFSIEFKKLFPIHIGDHRPSALTWSGDDNLGFYFATFQSWFTEEDKNMHEAEWRGTIVYRKVMANQGSIIYRMNINASNGIPSTERRTIANVSSRIIEMLHVPNEQNLVFTSAAETLENIRNFEMYSIDLRHPSSILQLTYNEALELDLQLGTSGRHVFYQMNTLSSHTGKFHNTQQRLYSIDLKTGHMHRFAEDFDGSIAGYAIHQDGRIYVLGQIGTEIKVYSQQSPMENTTLHPHPGWMGSYESIAVSPSTRYNCSIAVIHSSLQRPKEVFCVSNIHQLELAKSITSENKFINQRTLPQSEIYRWKNHGENRSIEGILHYPPGQFKEKNLPLLVLIHGGPYDASLNHWQGNGYFWAPLAASHGWLVLEPNYRGSTGYGDEFLSEVRYEPVPRAGKDILSAVDQLISEGIADSSRLAVGGYSFGGILTNWLITQTTRFNAALSGAGTVDAVSTWGSMDMPVAISYIMGGFPWEIPDSYQHTAPVYFLQKVRTPTLIVTGELDVRVPPAQSYILERGLHNLGVPVQLLIFPGEGHSVINSRRPSFGKIKVREELKWLKMYGQQRWNASID